MTERDAACPAEIAHSFASAFFAPLRLRVSLLLWCSVHAATAAWGATGFAIAELAWANQLRHRRSQWHPNPEC